MKPLQISHAALLLGVMHVLSAVLCLVVAILRLAHGHPDPLLFAASIVLCIDGACLLMGKWRT